MWWMTAVALAQAPPYRVIGFLGRPGGACQDRVSAQRGECIDVVDFFPLDEAWGGEPDGVERAVMRDLSRLQLDAMDGLAHRWSASDVEQTLRAAGFTALPDTRSLWQHSDTTGGAYALPPQALWLGVGDWYDPVAAPDAERGTAIFPAVRYAGSGQDLPPPLTVLSGRFAKRLGFAGRSHDYDLMDGTPESSGPFFEQLFPYAGLGDDVVYPAAERQPLAEFRFTDPELDPDDPGAALRLYQQSFQDVLVGNRPEDARSWASARFERFVRVVYVQTTQFAMESFTTNQMRVLAATTAMAVPPGALASQFGLARDLVAAARGETDTAEELLERTSSGPRAPRSLDMRYESLPREVVVTWVDRLLAEFEPPEAFYAALNEELLGALGPLLVREPPPLRSLELEARKEWLKSAVLPGDDREEVDTELMRVALSLLVYPPSDPELAELKRRVAAQRDRIESWMLADHARLAIASTFDDQGLATPRQVVDATIGQWSSVLSSHGYAPQPIPQGLGAVDPTAVCTTLDGVAALDEPAFGSVVLDVLVAAPPSLSLDGVLQAAADQMPFQMIDDPARLPSAEPLIALGDGRTLYRVRWKLWTGWHLFWDVTPYDDEHQRLVLRTGAVCADTVLAPPDLVPTIVRAGLLHGNLRPTTPSTAEEWRRQRPDKKKAPTDLVDPDALAGQMAGAPEQATSAVAGAKEALAAPPGPAELAAVKPTFGSSNFEIVEEPLGPTATYLGGMVQAPLRQLAGDKGLMVLVVDATAPDKYRRLGDRVPSTPYAREQQRIRRRDLDGPAPAGGRWVRTAAWVWWFGPDRPRPVQLHPGYSPKDSVEAGEEMPRWRRRRTVDFWLAGGAHVVPLLSARWSCSEGGLEPASYGGPCAGTVSSMAFGLETQGSSTWWFHDRPRFGLDGGLDVRLSLRPGGTPFLYDEPATGEPIDLAWAVRPQMGLLLGLRGAPRGGPLERHRAQAPLWGTPGPDGQSRLGRVQWGLRTGMLLGPGYEGVEGNVVLEGWTGWSSRRKRSAKASFTPYRPSTLLGPFARLDYGFPVGAAPTPRFLTLGHTTTLTLGFRTQIGLTKAASPPEGLP